MFSSEFYSFSPSIEACDPCFSSFCVQCMVRVQIHSFVSRLLRTLSPPNQRLSVPSLEIGDCLTEGSFPYHLPAVDARVCPSRAGTACVGDCSSSEPLEFSLVLLLETQSIKWEKVLMEFSVSSLWESAGFTVF